MTRALVADGPRSKTSKAEVEAPPSGLILDLGLIAAFLALTFLLGIFPLKDTDFWWHLKAGDLIRQTGQVPTVDTFTYGAVDHPWVDLHWGFQVALSWGFAHFGVTGLNVIKCAITTLAVGLLIGSRRREWPVWVMLLAWLPALLVLSGRMYIRPETISLLYLATVLAILFRWERRPWLAFALPAVQVCWVNTQGLFLLEPILIGFALAEATLRPGAFAKDRRRWWRIVGPATALTGLACLFNPYGLAGTLYPLQLAGTMSNPIFKNTIGELKPLLKFVEEVGLDSLPLQIHLATFALGVVSFLLPMVWRAWAALADRNRATEPAAELTKGGKAKAPGRSKKPGKEESSVDRWRPPIFRGLMFVAFSALSLAATRNSHQFAAVVGTVTAWNFAEWAGAIRARRLRLDPTARAYPLWPRLLTLGVIVLAFAAVVSGRFYAWSAEGRTVGIGEEPLWFPHDAVRFAGSEGMPDRLVGFHNGHPSLYEYEWAPGKKAYTDARLEVMGPDLYKEYLDLGEKIRYDTGNWSQELEKMGRPAVLIDNLEVGNAPLSATMLKSRHWRCVWFDPIVSLFVHDSYTKVIEAHGVDFAALHFRPKANDPARDDPASLAAGSRALRYIGSQCQARPGGDPLAQPMFLLGLDEARKLRALEPGNLDGWKQAGLIEYYRDSIPTESVIPRFRFPFDPVFDLPAARATYLLKHALELDPGDGTIQLNLSMLYQYRGMDEQTVPLLARFVAQPNKNLEQQKMKARSSDQLTILRAKLGEAPSTRWANLSELDRIVGELTKAGRVETLADLMETAYRADSRPWEWADRLAVLRLHLGEPTKARGAWLSAAPKGSDSSRLARIAATYYVEGDFDQARKNYREALNADPASFEALYGLASLERDAGRASEAADQARLAEKAASNDHSRDAARAILKIASPYAVKPPASR